MQELLEILKVAGPMAAMVLFFVWRDYVRENRMSERINKVEDYVRARLESVVERSNEVIEKNTHSHEEVCKVLNLRPCINGKLRG